MKKLIALMSMATLLLSVAPVFADTMPASRLAKMMVTISASGQANLAGTLKSMTSTTLTVASWGGDWTVNVSSTTKLSRKNDGKSMLSEFAVGDMIRVEGKASTTGLWTIDAKKVWDSSIELRSDLRGTISNLSGSTFTLTTKKGVAVAVTLNADAKIMLMGKTATSADLSNGMMVTVVGVWNAGKSTLMASKVTATPLKVEVKVEEHR